MTVKNGVYQDEADTRYWYEIEHPNGSTEWWLSVSCERHREDGPAIEHSNGDKQWFLNGEQYSEADFKIETQKKNLNQSVQDNLTEEQKIKTKIKP